MHIGIGVFMGMPLFALMMILLNVAAFGSDLVTSRCQIRSRRIRFMNIRPWSVGTFQLDRGTFSEENSQTEDEIMSAEPEPDLKLEIAHILLLDIVGYWRLLVNEQGGLREWTNASAPCGSFRAAEAAEKLIRLPKPENKALLFFDTPEGSGKVAPWKSVRHCRSSPACSGGGRPQRRGQQGDRRRTMSRTSPEPRSRTFSG